MTYTSIAIIYNPNSTGSSKTMAKDFADELRQQLPKQKIELIATEHAGHAEELAYSISKASKKPLIISSSGDGGYNEVINGAIKAQLEGFHPTTGLLPAGNANDHYHNLHDKELVDIIVKGETKHIDLLKITSVSKANPFERYAHSYIGFGLTPYVGKELNKTKLNKLTETVVVTKALLKLKPIRLTINSKTHLYDSIIFSNVDRMSKYLNVSQPSRVTDGKFEVTIFRRRNKLQLLALLLRASLTNIHEDEQTSSYSLQTTNKTLGQADGEIFSLDPKVDVKITIEKQILNCVV